MKQKKVTQISSKEKLRVLKHLPVCTVVLQDFILYPESIPLPYRHVLSKLQDLKPSPSCVNISTPKRFSRNLKSKEVQEQNVSEKENYIATKLTRSSKKTIQKKTRLKNKNSETLWNNESVTTDQDLLSDKIEIQPKLKLRKRRIISNSSNELCAGQNSDVSTYYSHECFNIETSKKKKRKLILRKILYSDESSLTDGKFLFMLLYCIL